MSSQTELKLAKWPFMVGNGILLVAAYFIYSRHGRGQPSMSGVESAFFALCVIAGAVLAVIPFIMEYTSAVKMVQTGALVSSVDQIKNVEELVERVNSATAQWQTVQEHSTRTATSAREITERMAVEVANFTDFMQKANDGEKAKLRLEVEKLRRAEGDWLQIIVRMLDHTFALHQAAVRSAQPTVAEQLGNYQNACRDLARRVGLIPFLAVANEPFDPQRHQPADSPEKPPAGALVGETLVAGFTYQGQLIRPALVRLQSPPSAVVSTPELPAEPAAELVVADNPETLTEPTLL